ncbi:restriction endonuclease [Bradyrhizobium barranii subsp. barranii]|nr:restriction endonuclease [Bradyrhizobium barranii]UGX99086.1 restriction endonuclease [Bradyrhizobium barranii subsp. barranii]
MLESLSLGYEEGKEKYIGFLAALSLKRHFLSAALQKPSECHYEASTRILLCEIEIPDFATLRITKLRGKSSDWVDVSAAEKKRLCETLVFALCIRAAYLTAQSDFGNFIDTVAVNALQNWFDPATGAPRSGTIASLQARKEDLLTLQPGRLDAKSCFAHLKGISPPSVTHVTPIRPIFVLDKKDHRIVGNRDVDASLAAEENLASIPWEDFEHLVRQLFEWEFGRDGVEVKVTRASRDRGVDAIMFDPDPLRGGKYVLQAKRYTRTVDVAAVRDLYGTVVNEGANRGILVTTSGFGPDSYDFAKDKPLSLRRERA